VLNYGCFDTTYLPSIRFGNEDNMAILTWENASQFLDTFFSNISVEERKTGRVSPLYNDMKGLTSALFLVGTEDGLLDDTVLMHFRWVNGGNHAVLKFVPGAPHGFMTFDGTNPGMPVVAEGWKIMVDYINERAKV
jgi:acetyl esterase